MISRFMGMLGLNDTEEYEDEEEIVNEIEETYERPARTGYFARRENEEKVSRSAKVLPMTGASPVVTSSKMVITEPQCFDDVKEISEHLKERRSEIVI